MIPLLQKFFLVGSRISLYEILQLRQICSKDAANHGEKQQTKHILAQPLLMRFIKSFVHKRTHSEPTSYPNNLPRSVVIDKAYNDLFASDHPSLNSPPCHDVDLENINLRRLSSAWALSHSRLVLDLNLTQSELHLECERNQRLRQQLHDQSILLEEMKHSLARHEHLISILDEIGFCEGVVTNAHISISEGQDAVHALIKAIKEAAAVPGSNWAVILPAVSGLRTQAEYIAALHLSLNVRKELRQCKKVTKFWKTLAQHQFTSSVVTPSVSALSSIYEKLSPERQDAVNVLVQRRKRERCRNLQFNGGILRSQTPCPKPEEPLGDESQCIAMVEALTCLKPPSLVSFSEVG